MRKELSGWQNDHIVGFDALGSADVEMCGGAFEEAQMQQLFPLGATVMTADATQLAAAHTAAGWPQTLQSATAATGRSAAAAGLASKAVVRNRAMSLALRAQELQDVRAAATQLAARLKAKKCSLQVAVSLTHGI